MAIRRSDYERQPAPEFLFQRRPVPGRPQTDTARGRAFLITDGDIVHTAEREEERHIAADAAPTLTITSDPHSSIAVIGGTGPDWRLFFRVWAGAQTERDANERLRLFSLNVLGETVSLSGPDLSSGRGARGELVVEGPRDAAVVIHASFTAMEVRDMTGPVRVAATHARTTILDTSGQVDATAGCGDFAGSSGRVTLSAESEINLKITGREFAGSLLAWAERPVRILVPAGFETPFEAMVGQRDDFVCRADFQSKVKHARQNGLHVFRYGANAAMRPNVLLRSEASTVVIDQIPGHRARSELLLGSSPIPQGDTPNR